MAESALNSPLTGYRVLDLAQPIGLHCTKLIADMGADVVKVERPGGDPARWLPPFKNDLPHPEHSLYFLHYNTNKRGITLDLETRDGQALFLELARRADVVVETLPPGKMDELGLGYDTLSKRTPGIVVASITPFGQTGPWRDYKATDIAGFAWSNTMALSGEPGEAPVTSPSELAYSMTSTYAAFGIAIALYHRMESGEGQYIDVSMHECAAQVGGYAIPRYSYDGVKPFRTSRKNVNGDHDLYPTKNGYVFPLITPVEQWRRFVDWMGRPAVISDPLFENLEYRRRNHDLIHPVVAEFCLQHTKEELYEEGQRRHLGVSPVNTPGEFMESAQAKARGTFLEMEHPVIGKYRHFGPLPKLSESPGRVTRTAPLVGQHNEEIYCGELGLSKHDLIALAAVQVI